MLFHPASRAMFSRLLKNWPRLFSIFYFSSFAFSSFCLFEPEPRQLHLELYAHPCSASCSERQFVETSRRNRNRYSFSHRKSSWHHFFSVLLFRTSESAAVHPDSPSMLGLCNFCKSYGFWGEGDGDKTELVLQVHPPVTLDTSRMGDEVVVIKNGTRLCGSGGCLATASIVQDKSYFEVKIQREGTWGVGLSSGTLNVNKIPFGTDKLSWVLREDGKIYHDSEVIGTLPETPRENDVLGVAYDHVEISFHLNGKPLNASVRGPKGGAVFPAFFVDKDAILDVYFSNFQFVPPSGFSRIMYEQTIL